MQRVPYRLVKCHAVRNAVAKWVVNGVHDVIWLAKYDAVAECDSIAKLDAHWINFRHALGDPFSKRHVLGLRDAFWLSEQNPIEQWNAIRIDDAKRFTKRDAF